METRFYIKRRSSGLEKKRGKRERSEMRERWGKWGTRKWELPLRQTELFVCLALKAPHETAEKEGEKDF